MFFRFLRPRPAQHPEPEFHFLDSGPLRDGNLELIHPDPAWTDALLQSVRHPDTIRLAPDLAATTPRQIRDFFDQSPHGQQHADPAAGIAWAYHFWMLDHDRPDLPLAGALALRVGHGADIELYYGHFGYHVFPPHRSHRFAARAVRLLMPLAARHQINPVWITCNPDNAASRRTCEILGGRMVDIVPVPSDHPLTYRGEFQKCRYRLDTH